MMIDSNEVECKDCKRAKEKMGKLRLKYWGHYLKPMNELPKQILIKTKAKPDEESDDNKP